MNFIDGIIFQCQKRGHCCLRLTYWLGSNRDGLQNQIILTPKFILCGLKSWHAPKRQGTTHPPTPLSLPWSRTSDRFFSKTLVRISSVLCHTLFQTIQSSVSLHVLRTAPSPVETSTVAVVREGPSPCLECVLLSLCRSKEAKARPSWRQNVVLLILHVHLMTAQCV